MKSLTLTLCAAVCAATALASDVDEIREKIEASYKVTSVDKFHGFDRVVFDFDGYEAWVVCPEDDEREGRPWTWTMQWATAFVPRTNVPQMLRDGYYHVTINTFKHRMDETGLAVSAAFQRFLVEKLEFAPKAYLIGMSWGGFFSVRYAKNYPQNVAKIYLDAPLLCFKDFRIGIGPWENRMPSEGWADSPEMPVNMAAAIAKDEIPVLILYGGTDTTCVPASNCELFATRFKKSGGDLMMVKRGLYAHHPHGVEVNENTIKDFFERPPVKPIAQFDGPADAAHGWKSTGTKEGEMVYLPFEGTFPSKGGRIECDEFPLDKTDDENAFYSLTFQAKGEIDGYWWVDFTDCDGKILPDVNSRLYVTNDWMDYDVIVPTRPEAARAKIAFVAKKSIAVRNVRMKRMSVADAADWVEKTYAAGEQLQGEVTAEAWKRLPTSKTAIQVATNFRIVFLGDSIMNDTWCGGFDALLRREYPDTNFKTYLSVRGSTGCWYYHEKDHFDEYVARFRPNLVVIGGISNGGHGFTEKQCEDAMVETIERAKAIGAEVVVCSPPKAVEPRNLPTTSPEFASDYIRRAADRAGVQFWDMTTETVGAVMRSGKPLGYFNRDRVHNDNRGKALLTMQMFRFFNAAQK